MLYIYPAWLLYGLLDFLLILFSWGYKKNAGNLKPMIIQILGCLYNMQVTDMKYSRHSLG